MSHLTLSIAVVAALLCACGQNPGDDDDTDATVTPAGGLKLEFESKPDIPGSAGGDFEVYVESATFRVHNLRAIGDAAPGDDRTRVESLTLAWSEENSPKDVTFGDAPLGMYSQLLGEVSEYSIHGTVKVAETTYPFEIEDEPPSALLINANMHDAEVRAGEVTEVQIEARVDHIVNEFDWANVTPNGDGVLVIDRESAWIEEIREEVDELLHVKD